MGWMSGRVDREFSHNNHIKQSNDKTALLQCIFVRMHNILSSTFSELLKFDNNVRLCRVWWEARWPPGLHAHLRIKQSRFELQPGSLCVLSSWARDFTLTVSLSTEGHKWVPVNLMLRGNLAMDQHSIAQHIQGVVEILLVASRYRNRDKLHPDGPLGSYADFMYLCKCRAVTIIAVLSDIHPCHHLPGPQVQTCVSSDLSISLLVRNPIVPTLQFLPVEYFKQLQRPQEICALLIDHK